MLLMQFGTEKIIDLANKHIKKHGRDGKIKELESLITKMSFGDIVAILKGVPALNRKAILGQLLKDDEGNFSAKNGLLDTVLSLVKGDLEAERQIEDYILATSKERCDSDAGSVVWAVKNLKKPRVDLLANRLVKIGFPRHMAEFAEAQPSTLKFFEDGVVAFDPSEWDMSYAKQMAEFSRIDGADKERIQRRVEEVSCGGVNEHRGCISDFVEEMGEDLYDFDSAMKIFPIGGEWQIKDIFDLLKENPTYNDTAFASILLYNLESNMQELKSLKNIDIQGLKDIVLKREFWENIINLAKFLSENYPNESVKDLEKEICKYGEDAVKEYVRKVKTADCEYLVEEFKKLEPKLSVIASMACVLDGRMKDVSYFEDAIIKADSAYGLYRLWEAKGFDKLRLCTLASEKCSFETLEDMMNWEGADREKLYQAMRAKGSKDKIENYDKCNHIGKEGVRSTHKVEDLEEMLRYVK